MNRYANALYMVSGLWMSVAAATAASVAMVVDGAPIADESVVEHRLGAPAPDGTRIGEAESRTEVDQVESSPQPVPENRAAKNAPEDAPEEALSRPVPSAVVRGVVGGPHDFSMMTGKAMDACRACHVPHLQTLDLTSDGDAWTIELVRAAGQQDPLRPSTWMPAQSSLTCLSCHNGMIASSTLGAAGILKARMTAGSRVDLPFAHQDHPIGVDYPIGNREYRPASAVTSDHRIDLPEGRVECISCHDPHNRLGGPHMLTQSNRRSGLCLSCHIK